MTIEKEMSPNKLNKQLSVTGIIFQPMNEKKIRIGHNEKKRLDLAKTTAKMVKI